MNIQPTMPGAADVATATSETRRQPPAHPAPEEAAPKAAAVAGEAEDKAAGPADRADDAERALEALERLAGQVAFRNTSLRFHVDAETRRIVVEVVDEETSEVIRRVPAKEALDAILRPGGDVKGGQVDAVG